MKYALAVAALTATAAAADCKLGSFEIYKDEKCKEIKAKATAEELKTMNKYILDAAACKDKIKQTCDAKGMSATLYKEDDCKTKDDKPSDEMKKKLKAANLEWGACGKFGPGGLYVKLSGAKALMASTAAALAFVGSQF